MNLTPLSLWRHDMSTSSKMESPSNIALRPLHYLTKRTQTDFKLRGKLPNPLGKLSIKRLPNSVAKTLFSMHQHAAYATLFNSMSTELPSGLTDKVAVHDS